MTCPICHGYHLPGYHEGKPHEYESPRAVLDGAWEIVKHRQELKPDHAPAVTWAGDYIDAVGRSDIVYRLTPEDLALAERCAELLYENGKNRADRQGQLSLASKRVGARGEVAFSKLTGISWTCKTNAFSLPDVGHYQVRASTGSPYLVVHENDEDATPMAAMQVKDETVRLKGWLPRAGDGKRPEWWRNPGGRRPAWFVPWAELDPPSTIPEIAATLRER